MSKEKELVCLTNAVVLPGAQVTIIPQAKGFREEDVAQVFVDDPGWGIMALTVVAYSSVTYGTFATWGSIMFDPDCSHFRAGALAFGGKVMAMIVPVGSRVLVS